MNRTIYWKDCLVAWPCADFLSSHEIAFDYCDRFSNMDLFIIRFIFLEKEWF